MKIDFYYWDYQCPINYESIQLLKGLDASIFDVKLYDIKNNSQLAKDLKIYFPTLAVFNDTIRWRSPINLQLINNIRRGNISKEEPYVVDLPDKVYKGQLLRLTNKSINGVNSCCTMTESIAACMAKGEFLTRLNGDFLGYLHYKEDKVIGGAEYIPSLYVPYDIPKDEDTAFLTCSYLSSDPNYDNKAYPLQALENDLVKSFKRIIAISDEVGVFPNGNLKWFEKHGYRDEGIISIEEDYARLHLVSKTL